MRHLCLGLIAWCSAGLGCTDVVDLYAPCANPNYNYADGNLDPCAAQGTKCPGGCIPSAPDQWEDPVGLWMGPEAEAPVCGPGPSKKFIGYTWPDPSPKECGACRCERPTGTCELPIEFTANGATCTPPPGTPTTSFDAPASWDGACTAANPVPMGVQSLSIGAMTINQTECGSATDPPPARVTQATPVTFGFGCGGSDGAAGCGDSGAKCAIFGPLQGYRQCIWKSGKHLCPVDLSPYYTERFIFYPTYEDTRDCSPCVCGVPMGSTCTAQISVYSNDTCSGNPIADWTQMNDTPCHDVVPGAALLSKQASAPIYTPGECKPFGGNPIGSIVGNGEPATACCIPQP